MGDISDHTATRIFEILTEVRDRGIRTEEHTKAMAISMSRLDHTVHGNGQPGLDERVRNLEANQRRASSAFVQVAQWIMPTALALMAAGALVWIKDAIHLSPAPSKQYDSKGDTP